MYVFQPRSPRISGSMPFSGGIVPLAFGKPDAPSVMHAMLLRVWLGEAGRALGEPRHVFGGGVAAGRGGGAGRAPRPRFIPGGVAGPGGGALADVGRRDRPAVARHRREAHVVEHDVDDVRRTR